jgi:hypothetical protein
MWTRPCRTTWPCCRRRACTARPESARCTPIHPTPSKEAIALLDPFERLGLDRIELVQTLSQAERALDALARRRRLGLRHRIQAHLPEERGLARPARGAARHAGAGLGVPAARRRIAAPSTAAALARPGVVKAGFGLGDDRKRIKDKLGVEPLDVLDLNHVFRQRGYRKDMGVKRRGGGAVQPALHQVGQGLHLELGQ